MSDIAKLISDLVAAGTPGDLIGRVAAALAERSGPTEMDAGRKARTPQAIRQERYRERKDAARKRLPDVQWLPLVGEVIRRDEKCAYCGATENLGADHVLPISRGGSNDLSNLVACCESCNKSKGGRTVNEWRSGLGKRHGDVTNDESDVSPPPPPSPDKEIPQTPLENNLFSPLPPHPPSVSKEETEGPAAVFEEFWKLYPNKVGKPEALKAFKRATLRVDGSTMMAGLMAYLAKDDDRPWCNPSTWLNQDRWADRPALRKNGHSEPAKPKYGNAIVKKLDELTEDDWQKRLDYCRPRREWLAALGPPPFAPGCKVPPHMLEERDRTMMPEHVSH